MTLTVRWLKRTLVLLVLLLVGPLLVATFDPGERVSWRDADRSSAGLAPDAANTPEAVVQFYAARAFSWRGNFAVHTWLAVKAPNAPSYTVYQVTGWRQPYVGASPGMPDRAWYGRVPRLLLDLRGEEAEVVLPKIEQAVADYPYPDRYAAWPGPNSNTFTAWVLRRVPELQIALPNTAVGKDYLGSDLLAATPSGSGYQLSLFGYLGALAGIREGLELNVLGLSIGVDPLALAVKLPGIGPLGLRNTASADL